MPDPLQAVRTAIERGDFAGAVKLWEEWSAALSARAKEGTATPAEWAATSELYYWSRQALQCARAHAGARLNTLHAANAYMRGAV
jgi:hypothetical protein